MTAKSYLEMCEQLGEEPDLEEIPPDLDDFPSYVHDGMEVFNLLPDLYMGGMDPLFIGKDFQAFETILRIIDIPPDTKKLVFSIVTFLNERATTKAKEEYERRNKKK